MIQLTKSFKFPTGSIAWISNIYALKYITEDLFYNIKYIKPLYIPLYCRITLYMDSKQRKAGFFLLKQPYMIMIILYAKHEYFQLLTTPHPKLQ